MQNYYYHIIQKKEIIKKKKIYKIIFILFEIITLILLKTKTIYINIDNLFPLFENNIDFYNNKTDIKILAFYSPYYFIRDKDNITSCELLNEYSIKQQFLQDYYKLWKTNFKKGYFDYYNINNSKIIKNQIKLAQSHGLFGFAIYYYWLSGYILFQDYLNNFLKYNENNFPFLLIWKKLDYTRVYNCIEDKKLNQLKSRKEDNGQFIKDIKKYILDSRYIRINGKPVIGISEYIKINKMKNIIKLWREKSRKYEIGEIYILININNFNFNIEKIKKIKLFDGAYDFPGPKYLTKIKNKNYASIIYNNIMYNNIYFKNISNDFPVFRLSILEYDNKSKKEEKGKVFTEYSPEKFNVLNKVLINWTRCHYNLTNRFIFVNGWNNWNEGNYLEPDEKYGYSYINALSKALFNISFIDVNYNISYLIKSNKIAVQVHVFYEYLLSQIINKTNNIPVNFDLFITTTSLNKSKLISHYIKFYSKANKVEIKIVENKGRDVLPFLNQMKTVIKNYKYICHIHTKVSKHRPKLGYNWRNYLYDNLLGNREIILDILSKFENYEKLGFIFPENYYRIVLLSDRSRRFELNKRHMNYLLKKLFLKNRYKIGSLLDFPSGNMFWARVSAIYQIFDLDINDKIPNEEGQLDCTIIHGIERIWLYLTKLNGYYYKKIFKYF